MSLRPLTILGLGYIASLAYPCTIPPLVVTNAAVLTPAGLRPNSEVLVQDGRIASITVSGKAKRPPSSVVIDAHGDALLPGLIDAHAHFFETGGEWPPEFRSTAQQNVFPITARQTLRSGVTSARAHLFDRVDGPALKKLSLDDCFPSPRLQIGGPGLAGGAPNMNDRQFMGYKDLDDAKQKLTFARQAGADWIALHAISRFPPEELRAIAAEAKRLGLRLFTEASSNQAIDAALAIKPDSLDYLPTDEGLGFTPAQLEHIRRLNLIAVPTIGYLHRAAAFRENESLWNDPLLRTFMPGPTAAHVFDPERFRKNLFRYYRPSESLATANECFRQLLAAKIPTAIGTDSGSPANFHIDAIWWDLETRRKLGVPPAQIIESATINGARVLDDRSIGVIKAGARGDLVLYKGRLDRGSFTLDRVLLVAKGGKVFVKDGKWMEP